MTMATTTSISMMTIATATFEDDSNAAAAAAANSGGDAGEDHSSWSHFHDEAFVDVFEEAGEEDAQNAVQPLPVVGPGSATATAVALEQDLQQQQQQQAIIIVDHLPPQLHPAVSAGIRHVSSCYFSVSSEVSGTNSNSDHHCNNNNNSRMSSVADLLSLLDEAVQQEQENNNRYHLFSKNPKSENLFPDSSTGEKCRRSSSSSNPMNNCITGDASNSGPKADLFLNHDILMNVLTFLDAKSLAAFSETARRLNFEVFYFLQLQLQRSLLMVGSSYSPNTNMEIQERTAAAATTTATTTDLTASTADIVDATSRSAIRIQEDQHDQQQHTANLTDRSLSDIPGVASLARLAAWEPGEAQELVRLFLDSNSSLSTQHLPLSHSMAYLRQFLLRHAGAQNQGPSSQPTMASAALLVTLIGAASLMGQAATGAEGLQEFAAACSQASAEMIPNMLKLGFVGGLMGAAKTMSSNTEHQQATNINMRDRAEQMVCRMQSFMEHLRGGGSATNASNDDNVDDGSTARSLFVNTDNINNIEVHGGQDPVATAVPWTSNPYEHLPTPTMNQPEEDHDKPEPSPPRSSCSSCLPPVKRKTPTGCVGAYWKVVSRASAKVTQLVKDKRAAKFRALPREEQVQLASALIEACGSGSLSVVQDLIQKRACMDVDGFYASNTVGAGGGDDDNGVALTCALHTAAFYGSCEILDFLCRGIDEQLCHYAQDGGLCNVNLQDRNGYTALHFAVMGGINNDDSNNAARAVFEILVNHGADLQLEASSGYTPLQWAVRLQNHAAAQELRRQLEIQNEKQRQQRLGGGGWMNLPRKQHLSAIAKRFFDLVHSQ